MTHGYATSLLRNPRGSQRVTLLELFYDLTYVAGLSLISMNLARRLTWVEALHALLPLMAIWWVWSITALVTDFYDPNRLPIQALIVGIMIGTVLLATTLPQAFGAQGMVFAITYVAIHVGRGVLLIILLRGSPAWKRAARFLFWFGVSAIPWLIGAFTHGTLARAVLWGVALLIEYVLAGLRYPTPWLGRHERDQYDRAQEHVGERYQQFMILALGELILVTVLGYNRAGLGALHTISFVASFAATISLWQIYVYRAGSLLRHLPKGRPGRILRWAPYTHFIMIAGIVAAAAGARLVILRPTGSMPTSWVAVLFGGSILFLIGRTTFEYEVFEHISWSRLAWLAVLIAVSPAMVLVSPLTANTIHAVILIGVAVSDAIRGRAHARREDGERRHATR
ncbi:low temperature requirement protein A [Rugosimonospora acidiphila]|uniref:Low temperature requirement protein A n=1 Tax=Rugosimonospora acidiphila TaxID=556531 RepID=A0ABP9SN05_9ACTN